MHGLKSDGRPCQSRKSQITMIQLPSKWFYFCAFKDFRGKCPLDSLKYNFIRQPGRIAFSLYGNGCIMRTE